MAAWTLLIDVHSYHGPQSLASENVLKFPEARHLNAANMCHTKSRRLWTSIGKTHSRHTYPRTSCCQRAGLRSENPVEVRRHSRLVGGIRVVFADNVPLGGENVVGRVCGGVDGAA